MHITGSVEINNKPVDISLLVSLRFFVYSFYRFFGCKSEISTSEPGIKPASPCGFMLEGASNSTQSPLFACPKLGGDVNNYLIFTIRS